MQRQEEKKLQQHRCVQQCNLEFHSNESLSVLASSSLRVGSEGSVVNGVTRSRKPSRGMRGLGKGVTTGLSGSEEHSGSSDPESSGDVYSPSAEEMTVDAEQSSGTMELQVYAELAAIRDKMKEQLQALVLEERRVQELVSDAAEREVGMERREEEMKGREVEIERREVELRKREEKLKTREEEIEKKEGELKRTEGSLADQEEMLGKREVEVEGRECDVSSRERGLSGREERVREMERLACEAHESLVQCIEHEVQQRVGEVEGGQREEAERLEKGLKERVRDLRRLRQCYEAVKQSNESLKRELKDEQEKNSKLQSQLSVSQNRIVSLQQKNEQLTATQQQRQLSLVAEVDALKLQFSKSHSSERKKPELSVDTVSYEVLGAVINWLCAVHLSQPLSASQLAAVQQTSSKILPSIATLMSSPSVLVDLQQPLLLFVYWCVAHLATSKRQKSALASTLRRIGEAVYTPVVSEARGEKAESVFFNSSDIHSRMLSCLLILHTVTQVDCLAKVFEQLQYDLKEQHKAQQLFLLYHGVDCILPYLKATCRVLCTHTVNTYLLLSVESALLPQFLQALSTERWFSACAALLRDTSDMATLEKTSIILQRLSKTRGIQSLFERQRVRAVVQELLRQRHSQPNSAFFCLNLQSTLTNLDHHTHHLTYIQECIT